MATYTWTGAGSSGVLTDPGNWTVNGSVATTAPGSSDDVVIPAGKTLTVAYTASSTLSWASLTIEQGATLAFSGGSTVTIDAPVTNNGDIVVNSGEKIVFAGSVTGSGELDISGGAKVTLDKSSTFGTISATGSGAVSALSDLTAVTASVADGASISVGGNLLVSDRLSVASTVSVAGSTILGSGHAAGSDTEALALSWGASLTSGNGLSVNGTYVTSQNVYSSPGVSAQAYQSSGVTVNCFLAGSMIRTPAGEVAVEDVRTGDEIIASVWRDDGEEPRRVIWAGTAHVTVRPDLPDDEAGYPVRILRDAIADGVPCKDMLITPEHCLFFDGKFIPVRLLVNGRSIFYDRSIASYDYYHIETEQHSVITVDGVLTETYLDTGNRHGLRPYGNGKIVEIRGSRNLDWSHAAAPLDVTREFAESLFRRVEARAVAAGHAACAAFPVLTVETGLHLVTGTGKTVRKIREHDGYVMFVLPPGERFVKIVSNASRPCDVTGPFVDDRRSFGVSVGEVVLFEAGSRHVITDHLTVRDLEGWNTLEDLEARWTSGNARLPLGGRACGTIALLAIQITASAPYLLSETKTTEKTRRA